MFIRGGSDSEELTFEDDSVKSHEHSFQDTYINPWHDGCPSGSSPVYGSNGYGSNHNADDPVCKWNLSTGVYGEGDETKPKNMKAIFIIRVL